MYVFDKVQAGLLAIFMIGLGALGYELTKSPPPHVDYEVEEHFIDYRPQYNFDECRVWIDYTPHRDAPEFDKTAAYIVRDTIASYDKYMLYLGWADHGGKPGIHLAFMDHCKKRYKAAKRIAQNLVQKHPDIKTAHVVAHTPERAHLDIGPQLFMEFYKDHAPPLPQ